MQYLGDNGNSRITGRWSASVSGTSSPIVLPTFERIDGTLHWSGANVLCVVDARGSDGKAQLTGEDPESLSANSIWFDWVPGTLTDTASGVVIDAPVTAVRLVGSGTSATSTTSGADESVTIVLSA